MKVLNDDSKSINGTFHKIEVIDQSSFRIGDTSIYSSYDLDGTARNIKKPFSLKFRSLEESAKAQNIDSNLEFYDW
jgi:hypothetical protein